jgi:ribonucleoside-diphosphate reductase beta chain
MLLDTRLEFYPFQYPEAYDFYKKQQQAHWLIEEINLSGDVNDWKLKLNEAEKNLIGMTLKGFTSAEVLVANFWIQRVTKFFKHPEIQMMAQTNASFEAIHADAYSKLNITLGLDDFKAFTQEPTVKAKLDRFMHVAGKTRQDLALSLATFSAFGEGVMLFSSFAILLNFSRFNKMKGMGQVISFSIRDESLHSDAGCWLFRQLMAEYPELFTDELKKYIYDAARLTVELEDNFIDKAFEMGAVEGLDPSDLKAFIRHRANTKLADLGLKSNWKNTDKEAVSRITSWFDVMSAGIEQQDFFSSRPTAYAKATIDWSTMWEATDGKLE